MCSWVCNNPKKSFYLKNTMPRRHIVCIRKLNVIKYDGFIVYDADILRNMY